MDWTAASDTDVESLERATLAAVPPEAQEELHGWLLGFDTGTVGRAHSAAPLRHAVTPDQVTDAIEQRYRVRGFEPIFRIPRQCCFDALHAHLADRGWHATRPTQVQIGAVQAILRLAQDHPVDIAPTPSDGWASVFLGDGFDPVDGASRLAILRRARDSVFAAVRVDGRVAAVGSACFSHGWCGVHGMRTAPTFRGRAMAASILRALAQQAMARSITRAFLQVQEENEPARSLYRRAGFATAWTYEYWARAQR